MYDVSASGMSRRGSSPARSQFSVLSAASLPKMAQNAGASYVNNDAYAAITGMNNSFTQSNRLSRASGSTVGTVKALHDSCYISPSKNPRVI
jgi:hypothetical protein